MMLNIPTEVAPTRKHVVFKPYQYILVEDMDRESQSSDDAVESKDRHAKLLPSVKQRKLEPISTAPRGFNLQSKQEFKRSHNTKRDSLIINHHRTNVSALPPINPSSMHHRNRELSRNHTLRLSAIFEENPPISALDRSRASQERILSLSPSRTSSNRLTPILKQSPRTKINGPDESYHLLEKYSLHRMIAKTSDDRCYFQKRADLLNEQKRFIEQKLKELLQ